MPRYVSLFSSTISFASFTLWQGISYQLITVKKFWELNKFLNSKIVIYKIIISFQLIGLIFFLLMQLIGMVAVEVTGRLQISFCLGCELSLVFICMISCFFFI